jgi:hypothetical protein
MQCSYAASLTDRGGYLGPGRYIRIKPEVKWSWGLEAPAIKEGRPYITKTKV